MLSRKEVLDYLNDNAKEYVTKLENMSEEGWKDFSAKNNINNIEDGIKIIEVQKEESHYRFTALNDLVSFGKSKNTIHIHLIPKDAKFLLTKLGRKQSELLLIEALEKIKGMLKKEENINISEVYAVSGIMKPPISTMFSELGFDIKVMKIEDAKKDRELENFYERFKDKKDLGRAMLSREKLMSEKWQELIDDVKIKISQEIENMRNKIKESALQATQDSKFSSIINASDNIQKESMQQKVNKGEII